MPMVNEGDAICHLGYFRSSGVARVVADVISDFDSDLREDAGSSEQPIV
ncbi:MAG: hypothetical protein ACYTF0_06170 [Planctomycetota bacterium]|jgi:hypothetical protein